VWWNRLESVTDVSVVERRGSGRPDRILVGSSRPVAVAPALGRAGANCAGSAGTLLAYTISSMKRGVVPRIVLRPVIRCLAPDFLLPPFTRGVSARFCALSVSGVFFLDMRFKGPAET